MRNIDSVFRTPNLQAPVGKADIEFGHFLGGAWVVFVFGPFLKTIFADEIILDAVMKG